jgi:transcriptional regulator with XRE-family HTH domain
MPFHPVVVPIVEIEARWAHCEDHIMDRPGEKLKRTRERLKLTFRDVENASLQIASRRDNDEFVIALSRLADIENKGTVPSIFRLYTLCAIYRLDFDEVLQWYGVPREHLAGDAMHIRLEATHEIHLTHEGVVAVPQSLDCDIDLDRTTFLSQIVRRWGKMPLAFLGGLDLRRYRYGFIGLSDWSMYPVLQPGSLVMIDESKRRVASDGWTNEFNRPIYFLEHREGYMCSWCSRSGDKLTLHPHPASDGIPAVYLYPSEIEVVGQVTGVAMLLESRKPRPAQT